MSTIEKVGRASREFLKKTLNAENLEVIRIEKNGNIWETEVEVYEESAFIKSLGLPSRVPDRHIYEVKLDDDLTVHAYARKDERHA